MRILHIMAGKGNGGAELYSTDVILSLHEAGIDQCVVMRETAPRIAELTSAGVRMAPAVLRSPVRFWQRMQLRRLIAREKPDIIQCWMRRAAELTPKKIPGNPAVIGWFGDYEELSHFAHCTEFVGVTQDLVAHMQNNGVPGRRTTYIPTFPSVENIPALDRATLDTPGNAKVLLTLSRLHATKGLDTVIHALRSLPDCYLWIAGDGPLRTELENLSNRLGLTSRVRFLGWRTDRGAVLRAADICVLASRFEPFGTVILDAWSTKIPLVACASAGPKAHVQTNINGMLIPIDDPAAMAQAVRALIDNNALRQDIIATAYATYLDKFTRQAVTSQYIAYYKSLLPPQKSPKSAADTSLTTLENTH